jgi:hypothetical protein
MQNTTPSGPLMNLPPLKTDLYDGDGNFVETVWHFDDPDTWRELAHAHVAAWEQVLLMQHSSAVLEAVSTGVAIPTSAAIAVNGIKGAATTIRAALDAATTLEALASVEWASPLAAWDLTTEKLVIPAA